MKKDYYKSYKYFKIIQLAVLIAFAVAFFCYLFFDDSLRQSVFSNETLLPICVFLWAFMIYSAISIIWDFHQLEGNILHDQYLSQVAFTDELTGIPNRLGIDRIFIKYGAGVDISKIGCALISISNLEEVNSTFGRLAGDKILCDFSKIIEKVSLEFGFIGRNNGNEFLAVIEECDEGKMQNFLTEMDSEIEKYNVDNPKSVIEIEKCYVLNSEVSDRDFNNLIGRLYCKAKKG